MSIRIARLRGVCVFRNGKSLRLRVQSFSGSFDTTFASVMLSEAKHPGIFSAPFELTNAGILRFALQKLKEQLPSLERVGD
jgi:hypothetical protein